MIDIKGENVQLNSIWCAYSSYMNMLHIFIWKVYLSPMESNMWANNLRIRFFFLPIWTGSLPLQQLQNRQKIQNDLRFFISILPWSSNLKILPGECFFLGL